MPSAPRIGALHVFSARSLVGTISGHERLASRCTLGNLTLEPAMKLIVASVVAMIALASWDLLAHNGQYRRAVSGMAAHIAAAYHVR